MSMHHTFSPLTIENKKEKNWIANEVSYLDRDKIRCYFTCRAFLVTLYTRFNFPFQYDKIRL